MINFPELKLAGRVSRLILPDPAKFEPADKPETTELLHSVAFVLFCL
jgi:hypothetical protein